MMALSNRLPFMFRKPASDFIGFFQGQMTSGSWTGVPLQFSASDFPFTVTVFLRILPAFSSSFTTAGTPPAR